MMPSNYYDDEEEGIPQKAGAAENPETESTEEEGDQQTYVLPKECSQGRSVGDTITLKIVAEHDDSVEVEPTSDKSEETPPQEMPMEGKGMMEDDTMY